MEKFFSILISLILSSGIDGQSSILFSSNWSGDSTVVNSIMSTVFNNYLCPTTYVSLFVTPGLSFLSPIADMVAENNRLTSSSVIYEIGDNNDFLNFIFPPVPPIKATLQQMYPTDSQLIQVVLAAVNALYDPSVPKANILVILSRTNNVNNLNVNNYKNFITLMNQLNWYNVMFLDYKSADNVVYQLRLNPYYNIITLLSDPSDNRDMIQKVYLANLMGWRYRWIIVNLLGEYTLLQNPTLFGVGVISNNVTIITFADPLSGSTGQSVLLQDSLKVIRIIECDATKPDTYVGLSGNIVLTTYIRNSFKYTIFQNPGRNMSQAQYIIQDLFLTKMTFPPTLKFVPFNMNVKTSLASTQIKVFRIGFVSDPPFAYKNGTNYTGFLIDLLVDVLTSNNISYVFIDMTVKSTGTRNASNLMYSQLLGQVQNGVVDTLTLAFIITIDRLNYFDFANNFLSGSISVLYKIRTQTGINALQNYGFPFDWNVWVTFLGSALGIAIALSISDYVFPDKFARYKLLMSLFFSFSSLTHGAYFNPPRKLAGIIIMSFWWLFCLLVVIFWVGNYTAFLSQNNQTMQLTTFFTLLQQKTLRYGTLNDTLVFNYLSQNNDTNPQSMLQIMSEDTVNGTIPNLDSAVTLVNNDNYCFVHENRVVWYLMNRYCLAMFGSWLTFEYGLVLPKDSEKTMIISSEFSKRLGNGMIDNLLAKYWPNINGSCNSTSFLDQMTSALQLILPNNFSGALDIDYMVGVFVILLGGGVGSLILALIERLIRYILQKRVENRDMYNYDRTVEELTKF